MCKTELPLIKVNMRHQPQIDMKIVRARAWKRNIIPRVIGDFLFIVSSLLRALPVYHEGNEKSCGG